MSQNKTAVPGRTEADMAFVDLYENTFRVLSILNATLSLNSLKHARDDEHSQIAVLLEVCRECAEALNEVREQCETAYSTLARRVFSNPKQNDPLDPGLMLDLLVCASEATDSDQWRQRAALLGNSLVQYARYNPSLMLLVSGWRALIVGKGGRTDILTHHDGSLELVYYSVRKPEVTDGPQL